jgi:hypothetical protein
MGTESTMHSRNMANLLLFGATAACVAILLSGCQQRESKIEIAQTKVTSAAQDLKEVKREVRADWQESWLSFKRESDMEIAANERSIIDLRREVTTVRKGLRDSFTARIDDIERRNTELRNRVNEYKDDGDEKWELFKKAVRRDMDNLNATRVKIVVRNS